MSTSPVTMASTSGDPPSQLGDAPRSSCARTPVKSPSPLR
jgi:hypothetical protein